MNATSILRETLSERLEWRPLAVLLAVFLALFFLPVGVARFDAAVLEGLLLAKSYAREHVLTCLVPAFFIAGAVSVFLSDAAVLRYLGAGAHKLVAYGVAAVSGSLLAVCSCTVLPLFAGIHRRGAGLGPATAFLYSGPAINVMAIVLTAQVLGWKLGLARAVAAVVFAVVVGASMAWIFRREEAERQAATLVSGAEPPARPLWQNGVLFASLVAVLVFANWSRPASPDGLWAAVWQIRWPLTAVAGLALAVMLTSWLGVRRGAVLTLVGATAAAALVLPQRPLIAFSVAVVGFSLLTAAGSGEAGSWYEASWGFARQILPLLFVGVFVAGVLLGRPGHEGLIPSAWVAAAVGGNSLGANLFASLAGAFMYFATLTEVPIVEGLLGAGMGAGPALALLLAGPALSLPNMLVIATVLGWRKTSVYVSLVVVLSTLSGILYGSFFV